MVCLTESANAGANQPEKGRGIFRIVEKIGEVESEKGKVICSVYARVYIPKEPLIVVKYPLSYCCIVWKRIAIIAWTKNGRLWRVDVIALVELAFEIWQAHHDS